MLASSADRNAGSGRVRRLLLSAAWHVLPLCLLGCLLSLAAGQRRYSPSPAEEPPKVPGFGPLEGTRPIPGFGLGADAWAIPVTSEDLARANDRLQQYDTNRDGYLDRNELQSGRWSGDVFEYDRDRDGRLSRLELAQRYAQRRLADSGQPWSSSRSGSSSPNQQRGNERQQREEDPRGSSRSSSTSSRSGPRPTRESWHLAQILMGRHDLDRDGSLDASERRAMGLDSAAADTNRDRRIDTAELAAWLTQQEAERALPGRYELPDWFLQLDSDGDGQVQMSEFVAGGDWSDERLQEFAAYDANGDGILVADEVIRAVSRMNREHADYRFRVIPMRGIVRAQIEVADQHTIADLDVQLSITHTHVDHLDVYLFGPRGERVELFTGVGGSDDHFDNTILDEEAPTPIVRGRPPFAGRYHTEDRTKGRPGLKQFYGQSMEGAWTLMIEAKSDRPGALHSWALVFKPVEDELPPTQMDEFD